MSEDFVEEFKTIDLLRQSNAETRGVDAFALSLMKTERQMRRLFTHLIFQYPCFDNHQVADLRNTLAKQKGIYFDGFMKGFDALYSKSIKELIGTDYDRLRRLVNDAILIRNKIFHGQITDRRLTRDELFQLVDELTLWCSLLAKGAITEFGYDGFGRNSYRKTSEADLPRRFKIQFGSLADYEAFLKKVLSR